MKKLIFVLVMLLALAVPVFAAGDLLVDEADILTGAEEEKLQQQLEQLQEEYDMDAVIVIVEGTDGQDIGSYADDYYDNNGYAKNGVLLLYDVQSNYIWITGTNEGADIFTEDVISSVLDEVAPLISEENYVAAFEAYIDNCDYYMDNSVNVIFVLIGCLVIGLVAALIVTGIFRGQLKSVHRKSEAREYVVPGSLVVTRSNELFLYSNVRRVKRQQSSSGTHISSSGNRHSGGGRRV